VAAQVFTETVAYDKGKPAARQGRKAVSLFEGVQVLALVEEVVWLPKAIGKSRDYKNSPLLKSGDCSLQSCISLFTRAAFEQRIAARESFTQSAAPSLRRTVLGSIAPSSFSKPDNKKICDPETRASFERRARRDSCAKNLFRKSCASLSPQQKHSFGRHPINAYIGCASLVLRRGQFPTHAPSESFSDVRKQNGCLKTLFRARPFRLPKN